MGIGISIFYSAFVPSIYAWRMRRNLANYVGHMTISPNDPIAQFDFYTVIFDTDAANSI